MDELSLKGRRIAVPETRELEVFAAMLERRGAQVRRCPLVGIRDAPDPQPVLAWLRWFCSGACDDLILLTGEGLRRLLVCLDRQAPELKDAFLAQLGRVRTITRGPKPGRALRELGLRPGLPAESPTTAGVIATLATLDLRDRAVAVQLYGSEPNLPLQDFLRKAGAQVHVVAPYVYADASEDAAVTALIDELVRGELDAIAFTSSPQIDRLLGVARAAEREVLLREALQRMVVAAIGPVVAQVLKERGLEAKAMPADSFFMKPLATALEQALESRPPGR